MRKRAVGWSDGVYLGAGSRVARRDTRQADYVASAACAVEQWTKVLRLVLSLEPSAVRMLTDLIEAAERDQITMQNHS